MTEMTPEHAGRRLSRGVEAYFDADDEEFVENHAKDITVAIRAAVQTEHERTREACAKVVEDGLDLHDPRKTTERIVRRQIAAAIRAMPEQDPA